MIKCIMHMFQELVDERFLLYFSYLALAEVKPSFLFLDPFYGFIGLMIPFFFTYQAPLWFSIHGCLNALTVLVK